MLEKEEVFKLLKSELIQRISALKNVLNSSFEAVASEDTKSSAGDKHETSVSMAQLEQEKLTHQINVLLSLEQQLNKIQSDTIHTQVQLGSLIETNKGVFYISIGLGNIKSNDFNFFAVGKEAPLVQLLIGKKIGQVVEYNGSKTEIIRIV